VKGALGLPWSKHDVRRVKKRKRRMREEKGKGKMGRLE